jgi:hypothetical protein
MTAADTEIPSLLTSLRDKLMGPTPSKDDAAGWLGEPTDRADRYFRIKPSSSALAQACLRFENLPEGDGIPTTIELHFGSPWKTNRASLEKLFGTDAAWLEHVRTRRTLCFEVTGDGDTKGTVCIRVELPGEDDASEWTVPSALIRRIYGPRRA